MQTALAEYRVQAEVEAVAQNDGFGELAVWSFAMFESQLENQIREQLHCEQDSENIFSVLTGRSS